MWPKPGLVTATFDGVWKDHGPALPSQRQAPAHGYYYVIQKEMCLFICFPFCFLFLYFKGLGVVIENERRCTVFNTNVY